MPSMVAGIGTEAVEDATGRGWDGWLAELDDRDAEEREAMREHWRAALDRLEAATTGGESVQAGHSNRRIRPVESTATVVPA